MLVFHCASGPKNHTVTKRRAVGFVQRALSFEEYTQWRLNKRLNLPGNPTHMNVFLFSNHLLSPSLFLFDIARVPLMQCILESTGSHGILGLFSEVNCESKPTNLGCCHRRQGVWPCRVSGRYFVEWDEGVKGNQCMNLQAVSGN